MLRSAPQLQKSQHAPNLTENRRCRAVIAAAAAGCALLLNACQSVDGGMGADDGRSAHFRDRHGWGVAFVAAESRTPAYCRGTRTGTPPGVRITFLGSEAESGFRIDGLASGTTLAAGDEIVANFDAGERRSFTVQRTDAGSATVTFPTRRYEDLLYPFAHSRSVELVSRKAGSLGSLDLRGSAWTINATDECRRIKVPPIG